MTEVANDQELSSIGEIPEHQDKSNDSLKETIPLKHSSSKSQTQNTTSNDKSQGNYISIDSS